jgi:hypothetical protein
VGGAVPPATPSSPAALTTVPRGVLDKDNRLHVSPQEGGPGRGRAEAPESRGSREFTGIGSPTYSTRRPALNLPGRVLVPRLG